MAGAGARSGHPIPQAQRIAFWRIIPVLALAALAAGCQTASNTPSGSPEVTISGVRPDQAKSRLVNHMTNAGMRLKTDTAYSMTFERPWPNKAAAAAIAILVTSDISEPVERVSVSISDAPGGTRIVADRYMVKYAGTGREQVNPANNAPGLESLQNTLNSLSAR